MQARVALIKPMCRLRLHPHPVKSPSCQKGPERHEGGTFYGLWAAAVEGREEVIDDAIDNSVSAKPRNRMQRSRWAITGLPRAGTPRLHAQEGGVVAAGLATAVQ